MRTRRRPLRRRRFQNRTLAIVVGLVVAASGLLFVVATDGGRNARLPDPTDSQFGDVARKFGIGIETVWLTGAIRGRESQVFKALQLERNRLLIGFDGAAARARLEQLAWVKRASVARVFPNTLTITIAERVPFAVWRYGGAMRIVDRTGQVIRRNVKDAPEGLALVAGRGAGPRAREIVDLMSRYPKLSRRVRLASLIGQRRWMLTLAHGPKINLPAEQPRQALARLMRRDDLERLLGNRIETLDLRRRRGIVVRSRKSPKSVRHLGRQITKRQSKS